MSTQLTCKPQQASFINRMLRRNDSVMSTSTASSTTSSLTSLAQENDNLAQDNMRLQKRNGELVQQSDLNQSLFQETCEALIAKEMEITGLKECIHRNNAASRETIQTLGLQLQSLAEKMAEAQDLVAEREVLLADLKSQQQYCADECTDEQQPCQKGPDDLGDAHQAEIREKDKTIHFLRCRQAKSDKRLRIFRDRLTAAEILGLDWVETITLANSKAKAKAISHAGEQN